MHRVGAPVEPVPIAVRGRQTRSSFSLNGGRGCSPRKVNSYNLIHFVVCFGLQWGRGWLPRKVQPTTQPIATPTSFNGAAVGYRGRSTCAAALLARGLGFNGAAVGYRGRSTHQHLDRV